MTETDNNNDTAKVLELLASRICHDIISPVGAINNGLELMQEMGPDGVDDGLELVSYSAEQASAKLAAFRLAYGAGGNDPHMKPEDVQKVFGELIRAEGKTSQAWDPFGKLGPDPLPLGYCKMLMCSLMLAMESLPKGGFISVRPGEENQSNIIAEGTGAVVREGVEDALAQKIEIDDLDPRLVHPYAISVLGQSYGFSFALKSAEDGRVEFTMTCPAAKEEPASNAEDGSGDDAIG